MDENSSYGKKAKKPLPASKLTGCPVNYHRCEPCEYDDSIGCCPIGWSCMCRDGHLDMCETI